ncbi:MAG: enediyne biosynthesis protein [Gemmatimonadaceae bacterium]|nr:enediyne biosynthesis protein [Gemmatimonadaceae bacterium]
MSGETKSRALAPALATAFVVVALIAGYFLFVRNKGGASGGESGFQERAHEAGLAFQMNFLPREQGERFRINLYDHGAGLAVGDYDNDSREDIYFLNQHGPNALYRNRGDGTFEDVSAKAGVSVGDRVSVAATFADYDNDGWADLFVTSTRGGNVLFHNRGDGTFENVTAKAGVSHVGHSQTPVFFDYDNDGDLDLYVTNTAYWTTDSFDFAGGNYEGKASLGSLMGSPAEYNILYRNNGDGTFTDATESAGLRGRGWAGDVAVFDYDEDGFLDLFVPSMFGRGQLYRNGGHGTFTDVTAETLGPTSHGAIGSKVFDYDGDGRLDLFVVDMHSDMWMGLDSRHTSREVATQTQHRRFLSPAGPTVDEAAEDFAASQRRMFAMEGKNYDVLLFGNALYRNRGQGKFTETAVTARLETFWPWGIATGDYDNDGDEDVFITSGMGYPFYYWPNQLMMNNGDGTFRDRAGALGVEPPTGGIYQEKNIGGQRAARSSRSAAVADFDGDGRLDIVTNNFNDRPYFFSNRFARQNYVAFRLTGTRSNRDAIGAVVRLWAGKKVMVRQVSPAGGYLSQSSRVLHFGLGDRSKIDRIEIRWPRGLVQTLVNPPINTLHQIREPAQ